MSITNEDLFKLIKEGNNSLKQDFKELKLELQTEITSLKIKNEELENENNILKTKLLEIERRHKKYNIVIYGLGGDENETEIKVLQLFNETLQTKCNSSDFRDIFCVGKSTGDTPRPIIVETISFKLKKEILKNAKSKSTVLKNKKLYIGPEYATEDYKNRKLLGNFLKTAKVNKLDAKIKNNKLVIEEEEYTLEYLKNNPDFLKADEACASPKNPESGNSKEDLLEVTAEYCKRKLEVSPSKPTEVISKKTTRGKKK